MNNAHKEQLKLCGHIITLFILHSNYLTCFHITWFCQNLKVSFCPTTKGMDLMYGFAPTYSRLSVKGGQIPYTRF